MFMKHHNHSITCFLWLLLLATSFYFAAAYPSSLPSVIDNDTKNDINGIISDDFISNNEEKDENNANLQNDVNNNLRGKNNPITFSESTTTIAKRFIDEKDGLTPILHDASSMPTARTKSNKSMTAKNSKKTLNIHIVPHTHDDVGWLKTVDQYYHGWNNTIQKACVKNILDSIMVELQKNPKRTFTYVEMAFFTQWYYDPSTTADTRNLVKRLVSNDQLSFANGGWCMHDEAATHYMGMIDQTTLGHSFLKQELNYTPRVGWQLDPFGHSLVQGTIMTYNMGFDSLFFGRIDYQDLKKRMMEKSVEGFWSSPPSSSPSSSPSNKVFWGLSGSYHGNYGPPSGFCFDMLCGDPLLTNMAKNETALIERVNLFLERCKDQSDVTIGNNIMLTMGSDFQYQEAQINYDNMDLLIDSITKFQSSGDIDIASIFGSRFQTINVFYSTPEKYTTYKYDNFIQMTRAKGNNNDWKKVWREVNSNAHTTTAVRNRTVHESSSSPWTTKTDDFFPYSDNEHSFWTGYFTSRPGLKRLERVGSSFLHATRQIEAFLSSRGEESGEIVSRRQNSHKQQEQYVSPLRLLDEAVGVAQHHDGVSGTSKQHVAYDYAKRLQAGIDVAETYVAKLLKNFFTSRSKRNGGEGMMESEELLENLSYCQLLNETICQVSQDATKRAGEDFFVVIYNALATERREVVAIPVSIDAIYSVEVLVSTGESNKMDSKSISSVLLRAKNYANISDAAEYVLYFDTGLLPPIGAAVFRIKVVNEKNTSALVAYTLGKKTKKTENLKTLCSAPTGNKISMYGTDQFIVSNGVLAVFFDRSTGVAQQLSNAQNEGREFYFQQQWGYYKSYDGVDQKSGAYIFRPKELNEKPTMISPSGSSVVYHSNLMTEVHTEFEEPWIKQITRVKFGQPYIEVEYTVGPVPIADGIGKEVITRFHTDIRSNGLFYTDSNGRYFMERKRSYRPTWNLEEFEFVAGNYYPVNTAIYIKDEDASLSVLVDRSQGGSSLRDGNIELMVQRRTLWDDWRGVGEPMNETDGGITSYDLPESERAKRLGKGVIITGTHRIMIGNGRDGASKARSQMDGMFSQPHIFVGPSKSNTSMPFHAPSFSAVKAVLPQNVQLITFTKLHSEMYETLLIRLGHKFGHGEDSSLSVPVKVDLNNLFVGFDVLSVVEKTLSGNQDWGEWQNHKLQWETDHQTMTSGLTDENIVILTPLEIRTFVVQGVPREEAPSMSS